MGRGRRSGAFVIAGLLGGLVTAMLSAPLAAQASPDSLTPIFRRAQRQVNDGNGAEGRRIVDSVLAATEPRSAAEAEALFWRASLAGSWDAAQRDYLRLMLEHEHSPRAADAMHRLAQGETVRGDREAALRYYARLQREAPTSPARGEAGPAYARLLTDGGQPAVACSVLRASRHLAPLGATQLEAQYEQLLVSCPTPVLPRPVAVDSAATPVPVDAPTAVARPRVAGPPQWSVQVGAFTTASDAGAAVTRLRARGYAARVDGEAAPFRVRIGRYPSKEAAGAAAASYRAREKGAFFLVEVPPG